MFHLRQFRFRPMSMSMGGGLQQAAGAASFFPTAKELSSGLQWFKDHPVLAAAAATAVSAITYWNAELVGVGSSGGDSDVDTNDPAADGALPLRPEAEPHGARRRQTRPASRARSPLMPPLSRKSSGAVSWCDEHGGSLTQVFDARGGSSAKASDSDSDSDEELDVVRVTLERVELAAPRRGLRKSSTTQSLAQADAHGDAHGGDAEPQAESPQWGWYVPITPPQDQFQAGGASAAPPRAPTHASRPAPPPGASQVVQATRTSVVAPSPAMRRSTSGQIS